MSAAVPTTVSAGWAAFVPATGTKRPQRLCWTGTRMATLCHPRPKEQDGNGEYVDTVDYIIMHEEWETIKPLPNLSIVGTNRQYHPSGILIKVRMYEEPWRHKTIDIVQIPTNGIDINVFRCPVTNCDYAFCRYDHVRKHFLEPNRHSVAELAGWSFDKHPTCSWKTLLLVPRHPTTNNTHNLPASGAVAIPNLPTQVALVSITTPAPIATAASITTLDLFQMAPTTKPKPAKAPRGTAAGPAQQPAPPPPSPPGPPAGYYQVPNGGPAGYQQAANSQATDIETPGTPANLIYSHLTCSPMETETAHRAAAQSFMNVLAMSSLSGPLSQKDIDMMQHLGRYLG